MTLQFTVLGSGSSGNAALLRLNGFGLLLDAGLGPRQLAKRLATIGSSWDDIHSAILTHVHSDHWKDSTLNQLHRRDIPLHCHDGHHSALLEYGSSFADLCEKKLVRSYGSRESITLAPGLTCLPLPLNHDCGDTFGFRFDATVNDRSLSIGYVADLGSWNSNLANNLANVNLLAIEFNHDVQLEKTSGRAPQLISRVLGDFGHLSNDQACELIEEVLRGSTPGRLRHIVQLHLSRDCNRPAIAAEAAQNILAKHRPAIEIHTASPTEPSPTWTLSSNHLGAATNKNPRPRGAKLRATAGVQPLLPFMEE